MNTIQHNDWADSMASWGYENAAALKEHTALEVERRESMQIERAEPEIEWVEMQGRKEQGWPLRSGSPEWGMYAPDEDQSQSADMEVFVWLDQGHSLSELFGWLL